MRVTANSETCVTSSLCVYRVPGVFDQDPEGRVLVLDAHPSAELGRELLRAERGCPTRSITVEGLDRSGLDEADEGTARVEGAA
ncbi:ferredoxin [Streptacidiphilus sp. PB12-B1b]|nr:ferredoxin [Streptacidiphilus sp. PB12-B1b]